MPAPAVIPAPIAYIKVVAVKKLVVELQAGGYEKLQSLGTGLLARVVWFQAYRFYVKGGSLLLIGRGSPLITVYFEKIKVFKACKRCSNRLA